MAVKAAKYEDVEAGIGMTTGIPVADVYVAEAETRIRNAFIAKVYSVVLAQLAVTAAVGLLFNLHAGVRAFVITSPGMMMATFISTFAFLIALMCFRTQSPANVVLLAGFTLSLSYSVGVSTAMSSTVAVVQAFVLASAVFGGLTAYAHVTKKDFEFMAGFAISALLALIFGGLLLMFWPVPALQLVLAVVGVIVFSALVLVDTSRLIHRFTPDEWVVAAVNLYLDFVNLFLYILDIINARS